MLLPLIMDGIAATMVGDLYDAALIVYLTGLDWLVTNDKELLDRAHEVFAQGKKALTFEEFLEVLQDSCT